MKHSLTAIFVSTFIVACSSSGGGDSSSMSQRNESTETTATQPDITSSRNVRTEELSSSPGFAFDYNNKIDINLTIITQASGSLKICRVNSQQKIAENNCLVRTRITDNSYNDSLTISNDVTTLAMQVIIFDSPIRIENLYWTRDNKMQWNVEI